MKKIKSNNSLGEVAENFSNNNSSAIDIEQAGEIAMCMLYNGKSGEKLDILCHRKHCEKNATSTRIHVQPQVLPPTSAATKFHSRRIYYQICQWKGYDDGMSPSD